MTPVPEVMPSSQWCQRWQDGVHSWRHVHDGGFDARRHEVAELDEATAKRYVVLHHYSHSYPAAALRYGLYRATPLRRHRPQRSDERGRPDQRLSAAGPVPRDARAFEDDPPSAAFGSCSSRRIARSAIGAGSIRCARPIRQARRAGVSPSSASLTASPELQSTATEVSLANLDASDTGMPTYGPARRTSGWRSCSYRRWRRWAGRSSTAPEKWAPLLARACTRRSGDPRYMPIAHTPRQLIVPVRTTAISIPARGQRASELGEGLDFDLPDALAATTELSSQLPQSEFSTVDTEAPTYHCGLTCIE